MSIKLMALVWEHSPYSGAKLLIHLALADHADDEGYCYPGYTFLARKTRVSRRFAIDAVSEMEKDGYIIKNVRGHYTEGKSRQASNLYRVVNPTSLVNQTPQVVNPTSLLVVNHGSPDPSLNHHINHQKGEGKPSRKRDARLDHPAIIAYRSEARLHVPVNQRDDVIATVTDAELFKQIIHDWVGRGYNPRNITGILESYRSGHVNGRGRPIAPVVLPERPDVTAQVEAWTKKYKEDHPPPPSNAVYRFNDYWKALTRAQAEYRKSLEET